MAWTDIDVGRVRAEASETTTWLACIFSWMTPYEWPIDVLIVVAVAAMNHIAVSSNRESEAKKNGE